MVTWNRMFRFEHPMSWICCRSPRKKSVAHTIITWSFEGSILEAMQCLRSKLFSLQFFSMAENPENSGRGEKNLFRFSTPGRWLDASGHSIASPMAVAVLWCSNLAIENMAKRGDLEGSLESARAFFGRQGVDENLQVPLIMLLILSFLKDKPCHPTTIWAFVLESSQYNRVHGTRYEESSSLLKVPSRKFLVLWYSQRRFPDRPTVRLPVYSIRKYTF